MNEKNYIVVEKNALVMLNNTLRQIDKVEGFHNMDLLVGAVDALQKIILGSPAVYVPRPDENSTNPFVDDPKLIDAAEAAKAEEKARK